MVIFNHCTSGIVGGGKLLTVAKIATGQVMTLSATSMFFLISGYLFFRNTDVDNRLIRGIKLKKRFSSLVLPYLLWNAAALLMVFLLSLYSHSEIGIHGIKDLFSQFWCCNMWNKNNVNILGISMPMYGPIDLPLWYLRDLIVITFLSPVVLFLLKRIGIVFLLLLAPLFVFNIWVPTPGLSSQAVLFWTTGAFFAIRKKDVQDINSLPSTIKFILSIVTLGIFIWAIILSYGGNNPLLYNILWRLFTIMMVCCLIIVYPVINRCLSGLPNMFKESTFFVYALHAIPIIGPVAFLRGKELMFNSEIAQTACFFVIPFLVYLICSLCYITSKKVFPRLTSVFVGGR